jgi:hypothetical protein
LQNNDDKQTVIKTEPVIKEEEVSDVEVGYQPELSQYSPQSWQDVLDSKSWCHELLGPPPTAACIPDSSSNSSLNDEFLPVSSTTLKTELDVAYRKEEESCRNEFEHGDDFNQNNNSGISLFNRKSVVEDFPLPPWRTQRYDDGPNASQVQQDIPPSTSIVELGSDSDDDIYWNQRKNTYLKQMNERLTRLENMHSSSVSQCKCCKKCRKQRSKKKKSKHSSDSVVLDSEKELLIRKYLIKRRIAKQANRKRYIENKKIRKQNQRAFDE